MTTVRDPKTGKTVGRNDLSAVRLPGRIYETLNERAQAKLSFSQDVDVCNALGRPGIKRRGAGWWVYLRLNSDQIRRLAAWIADDDRKLLRDYRAELLLAAQEMAEREVAARRAKARGT